MSSVLGMLGPFQPPLGDTTPAFSFSLHLHLFLQGLPTPCCSPLFPITSLHNPSTPPNRALGFLSSLCLHCLPCSRVGGSSAPSSLPLEGEGEAKEQKAYPPQVVKVTFSILS